VGLLPTLGGQTGLNLATQLASRGVLDKHGVRLLGTPLSAIQKAEDRQEFRALMREIKEPVPESWIIETAEQLEAILDVVPYPCIIRPAYTLGGTGGGIARDREELLETGLKGLQLSMRSQIMVERSLLGWKEIEYEVMRDRMGNCITICNMENFDPMGVHTGDSIVVAPSQTLSDIEYHMLRTASLKIIRSLGIEGGCNVQLAVNPDSFDYYVIEVNPRVSRSSALASKATGYPIARVSAKIAVGRTLDEIDNEVTKTTKACFEPALDYCVVKIPRWPFDKFPYGDRTLFTQMKATGEVMAIDRSFEAAFMKAIRGLEVKQKDLRHPRLAILDEDALRKAVAKPTDDRLWAIAEALRRHWSIEDVHDLCNVDPWFLEKIRLLVDVEGELRASGQELRTVGADWRRVAEAIERAFLLGYPSYSIASILGVSATKQRAAKSILRRLRRLQDVLSDDAALATYLLSGLSGDDEELAAEFQILRQTLDLETGSGTGADFGLEERVGLFYRVDPELGACLEIERRKVMPVFKMVDTCAGEFESHTPYYYGTFEAEDDARAPTSPHGEQRPVRV